MDSYQNKNLMFKQLLSRIKQSKFYRDHLRDVDLNQFDLHSISQIPISFRRDFQSAEPFDLLACEKDKISLYHESHGSTGRPVSSWATKADLQLAIKKVLDDGLKLAQEDNLAIMLPLSLNFFAHVFQNAALQVSAGISLIGNSEVSSYVKMLQVMQKLNVSVVVCSVRDIEWLAETSRLLDKQINGVDYFPRLRAICLTGELLVESRRKNLERFWRVPIYNFYGLSEAGLLSSTCSFGTMHFDDENYHIEVLDEQLMNPVQEGERGVAIVTTFTQEGSPLLRYCTGDIVSLKSVDCICGKSGYKLNVYGRARDRIHLENGTVIDSADLQEIIYSLQRSPFFWQASYEEGELLLTIEKSNQWKAEDTHLFCQQIEERLKIKVEITMIEPGSKVSPGKLLELKDKRTKNNFTNSVV